MPLAARDVADTADARCQTPCSEYRTDTEPSGSLPSAQPHSRAPGSPSSVDCRAGSSVLMNSCVITSRSPSRTRSMRRNSTDSRLFAKGQRHAELRGSGGHFGVDSENSIRTEAVSQLPAICTREGSGRCTSCSRLPHRLRPRGCSGRLAQVSAHLLWGTKGWTRCGAVARRRSGASALGTLRPVATVGNVPVAVLRRAGLVAEMLPFWPRGA